MFYNPKENFTLFTPIVAQYYTAWVQNSLFSHHWWKDFWVFLSFL